MKKVGFLYDDIFLTHKTPGGHPESSERLISILNRLKATEVWDKLIHIEPRRALEDDILRIHGKTYFESVRKFTGFYDSDTFVSANSFEAAMYAAGAILEAIDRCRKGEIERAFCAVRPPGHHAEKDSAMGFCIFNNIAVGARYAQSRGYDRVFIIDFDVHHGNGTQHSFYEDDTVFYFSTHQYPHYPGTGSDSERGAGKGEGFTYNIPMHFGAGDKDYYYAYRDLLPQQVKKFRPDIILVSAGYDILAADPLSGINVTKEGLRNIVRGVLLRSTPIYQSSIPCIFALEGGYNLSALSEAVTNTIRELLEIQ